MQFKYNSSTFLIAVTYKGENLFHLAQFGDKVSAKNKPNKEKI